MVILLTHYLFPRTSNQPLSASGRGQTSCDTPDLRAGCWAKAQSRNDLAAIEMGRKDVAGIDHEGVRKPELTALIASALQLVQIASNKNDFGAGAFSPVSVVPLSAGTAVVVVSLCLFEGFDKRVACLRSQFAGRHL
jgi:hypothetical protein